MIIPQYPRWLRRAMLYHRRSQLQSLINHIDDSLDHALRTLPSQRADATIRLVNVINEIYKLEYHQDDQHPRTPT